MITVNKKILPDKDKQKSEWSIRLLGLTESDKISRMEEETLTFLKTLTEPRFESHVSV